MTLRVSMIVRNEADRHLVKALSNVMEMDAYAFVTDDCSDDDTPGVCYDFGATVRINEQPMFWKHEGRARQAHVDWVDTFCKDGDWILALDADETISHPEDLHQIIRSAEMLGDGSIGLRLHEFWTETEYRVDGLWFTTTTPRLYKWQPGGVINDREMGCGSEPTYVQKTKQFTQDRCHLLHWGYVRSEDRIRKHKAYSERLGGHGHSSTHVDSIVTEPMLRVYSPD